MVLADALPDDPGMLKVMLLAERARAERLEQIIKELRRHRFGRRAETLPEDQLLLGLEDVEQVVASREADGESAAATERGHRAARRRMNRGSLPAHLPRIEMWSTSRITAVRAAATRCIGSARIAANGSTLSRRNCAFLLCAGPSMPADAVKRWWCRLPRRPG